jgi:hypothetical protein
MKIPEISQKKFFVEKWRNLAPKNFKNPHFLLPQLKTHHD